MKIRAATSADIPSIMDLEVASPSAAHWSEGQYRELFQGASGTPRLILVAEQSAEERHASQTSTRTAGFLVARQVASEWELENIVVSPLDRRKGIGKCLLEALFTEARRAQSDSVFLEVRESNHPARSLYEKSGFQQTGRRKGYYANPAEDAVLYRWNVSKSFS